MANLCCFSCPVAESVDRTLDDICPRCGQPFGFPLKFPPAEIDRFRIRQGLGRGFYAATYVAEYGGLNDRCVLKVAPKAIYTSFAKDFEAECKTHQAVAQDCEHVVPIRDMFDSEVTFGDITIDCYIAVMDYVKGPTLKTFLAEKSGQQARMIAQIGVDLFRILGELEQKQIYHNDLHSDNIIIQQLASNARRVDAIDDSIRAVVVDLGSVSDASKSDHDSLRLGDIHWVATHLTSLVETLLHDPRNVSDTDYRLASLLYEQAHLLAPSATSQRRPSIEECINDIRDAYQQVLSPWKEQLKLKKFNDAYNAQTLDPWFVPHLLVDPENHWVDRISTPGPQVIIGMRGCGKTMVLRALQFHARATQQQSETAQGVLSRLGQDRFMGLYVSCTKLLDRLGSPSEELHEPYARLLVAYGLEALRAVRHLHEVDKASVVPSFYKNLAEAISDYLVSPVDLRDVASEFEVERRLLEILVSLSRGDAGYSLTSHPGIAFPHLAVAITKCSSLWNNQYVLFLLDDVSTRYLNEPKIRELLSALLFQHAKCAFKLTTEAQTLALALRSPGLIEKARVGRDYDVFDLGAEVYEKVRRRSQGGGKDFVESILRRRAKYYPNHPASSPSMALGDSSLQSIALRIASTTENSRAKKEVYHGISALAGVCVGDIGDVISIYELILKTANGAKLPLPASIQSQAYQDFCSRRLYDLNRREGYLKDFALSFAEASHDLLMQSYNRTREAKVRLRQYAKIYVRITTGNIEAQFNRLRELIDAGVFILAGGSDTPRTKTRDSDPIQQFVLTFRKLFGLSNFIGLSERDRFELSGEQLEEWLLSPHKGKEILMRNLVGEGGDTDETELEGDQGGTLTVDSPSVSDAATQPTLFDEWGDTGDRTEGEDQAIPRPADTYGEYDIPQARILPAGQLSSLRIDYAVIGLGFEDRSLESVKRLLARCKPTAAQLVRYRERGRASQIEKLVRREISVVEVIDYQDLVSGGLPTPSGHVFVDTTGLAKPAIFHAIRKSLCENRKVWLCDTRAETYYPLDQDIASVLKAERDRDHYSLLTTMTKILTGEKAPYEIDRLLTNTADESRRRVLCAFATPKHQRLFRLLDERDFDLMEIVVPKKATPRSRLARIAADVAVKNFSASSVDAMDSHDLVGLLGFLLQRYQHWYVDGGFNVELALTGSKIQAVACAAVAAARKISQCWYVRPQEFDIQRFTKGVGKSSYFQITME